jgi:hypothetical protein
VHEKEEVAADLTALLGCLKQQTELASKRKQQGQVGAFNENRYMHRKTLASAVTVTR